MDEMQPIDFDRAQQTIDEFVSKWGRSLFDWRRCDQMKAIWYLWIRLALGLRSLYYLHKHNDLTGCYVMARCCLEYDVSISAILHDAGLGKKYMDYDVHAKNRYLKADKHNKSELEYAEIERYLTSIYGPDFPKKKATSWYEHGFVQLCESAGRNDELAHYVAYCQITHGTITGMNMLEIEGLLSRQPIGNSSRSLLTMNICNFIKTTEKVINLIYGTLWTQEKEDCHKAYQFMVDSIFGPE